LNVEPAHGRVARGSVADFRLDEAGARVLDEGVSFVPGRSSAALLIHPGHIVSDRAKDSFDIAPCLPFFQFREAAEQDNPRRGIEGGDEAHQSHADD